MGTDIHLYVERREGTKWVSCDTWEPCEYGDETEKRLSVPYHKHFYRDRNYNLFAILADVRNGVGFAGIDMGDGFMPIAMPRGLPDDLSPELSAEAEMVDHTPTWLTLAEILAYNWTQTTTLRGVVNGPQFHKWLAWERGAGYGPSEYCGGISGRDIVPVEEQELERQVKGIVAKYKHHWDAKDEVAKLLGNVYAQVSWRTPYYRAAGSFLSDTIWRLMQLGKPEDVRIVFWFDS